MGKKTTKIAVLGLDALPFRALEQLSESSVAPNLFNKNILKNAKKVIAIPPVTQASWPSIMSGVNPGKHGLFFFVHIDDNDWFKFHYTNFKDLMHPRIHEMLSLNGINSLVLNPIPDYPIMPMKHMRVISNMFFTLKPISYPKDLNSKYYSGLELPIKKDEESVINYLDNTITLVEDQIYNPPDLMWLNFSFPDLLFHIDIDFVANPTKYKRIWNKIDKISKILKDTYDDVIVVSDHGFSLFDKQFLISDILYELRLAVPMKKDEKLPKYVQAPTENEAINSKITDIEIPSLIVKILEKTKTINIARTVYNKIVKNLYRRLTNKRIIIHSAKYPSFTNSIAVYPHIFMYGIYVKREEYVDIIINELRKYKALFLVDKATNVYSGPYVSRGPHIVVIPNFSKGYVINSIYIYGTYKEKIRKVFDSSHDLWGVLFHLNDNNDIFDWSLVPDEVPNHLVAGIVMCMMGQPLSVEQDDKELIERACRYPVSYKNYKTRFLLAKKLYFGKRSRGS